MNHRSLAAWLLALCLALSSLPLWAMEVSLPEGDASITSSSAPETAASHTPLIPQLYFNAGNDIVLDKLVEGTAFLSGRTVTVNGDVNGDLFAAGETVVLNGTVHGNVYLTGNRVRIRGSVDRDAFLSGGQVHLERDGQVGRDLAVAASSYQQLGHIGRDLRPGAGRVLINGPVDRDVYGDGSRFRLGEKARIGGSFEYRSAQPAEIDPKAEIKGETSFEENHKEAATFATQDWTAYAAVVAIGFLGLALIFLIWRALARDSIQHLNQRFFDRPLRALLLGLLSLILLLPVIAVLTLSRIGTPLAALLGLVFAASWVLARISLAMLFSGIIARLAKRPTLVTNIPLNFLFLLLLTAFVKLPLPHPALFGGTLTALGIWVGWSYLVAAFLRPAPAEEEGLPLEEGV